MRPLHILDLGEYPLIGTRPFHLKLVAVLGQLPE